MNIESLNTQLIYGIAEAYKNLISHHDIDCQELSSKKMKMWMMMNYSDIFDQLDTINIKLRNQSIEEIIVFFKQCYEQKLHLEKLQLEHFEKDLLIFDHDTKTVLKHLFQVKKVIKLIPNQNDLEIILYDCSVFRERLILKNIKTNLELQKDIVFDQLDIKYDNQIYYFEGMIQDDLNEQQIPFIIEFQSIKGKIDIFHISKCVMYWDHPWKLLFEISQNLSFKIEEYPHFCNEKEKELLPLLKEIVQLEYEEDEEMNGYYTFPLLKSLCQQYKYEKVIYGLEELEKVSCSSKKFKKILNKLISLLCMKTYEPLWRYLYHLIEESQKEYPSKTEVLCDSIVYQERIHQIQVMMEEHGYQGTYPNYVKEGIMKHPSTEQSYDKAYLTPFRVKVKHMIHCDDVIENNHLLIDFISGLSFYDEDDIYGCTFHSHGKTFFYTNTYVKGLNSKDSDETYLSSMIQIAIKKSEGIRLNRRERELYYDKDPHGVYLFLRCFFIYGFVFISSMIVTGILCIYIASLIYGQYMIDVLLSFPWWLILMWAWIFYGFISGFIEVYVNRK